MCKYRYLAKNQLRQRRNKNDSRKTCGLSSYDRFPVGETPPCLLPLGPAQQGGTTSNSQFKKSKIRKNSPKTDHNNILGSKTDQELTSYYLWFSLRPSGILVHSLTNPFPNQAVKIIINR